MSQTPEFAFDFSCVAHLYVQKFYSAKVRSKKNNS